MPRVTIKIDKTGKLTHDISCMSGPGCETVADDFLEKMKAKLATDDLDADKQRKQEWHEIETEEEYVGPGF